ncbi:MAG: hypothetical protein EOO07_14370 [Chitinophagaceae bacterium]|nr:MAG: hypothetical protein EOO07_14370 [Chitinophagaceae bacterium]
MYQKFRSLYLLFFCFGTVANVSAQSWDLGGFIGGTSYMGDLNPTNPLKINKNLAFGGQIKRSFNPYWSLKLALMRGTIEGDDSKSSDPFAKQRNLRFYSPITEVSLQTEFNFFNYVPSVSKKVYTPFLFAGIGLVGFNPKADYGNQTFELRRYGTEGQDPAAPYRDYALTVPLGFGFKYNFSGKWSLIAEAGYRTAYSDYLDDVSKKYPTEDQLTATGESGFVGTRRFLSDPSLNGVGDPGTQRGDLRSRDSYMFVGFSITYSIFKNGCPVVAY